MALRWREAETPAHFLLGLRKCCLRQRLPAVGWGGVKWGGLRSGVFLCVQGSAGLPTPYSDHGQGLNPRARYSQGAGWRQTEVGGRGGQTAGRGQKGQLGAGAPGWRRQDMEWPSTTLVPRAMGKRKLVCGVPGQGGNVSKRKGSGQLWHQTESVSGVLQPHRAQEGFWPHHSPLA